MGVADRRPAPHVRLALPQVGRADFLPSFADLYRVLRIAPPFAQRAACFADSTLHVARLLTTVSRDVTEFRGPFTEFFPFHAVLLSVAQKIVRFCGKLVIFQTIFIQCPEILYRKLWFGFRLDFFHRHCVLCSLYQGWACSSWWPTCWPSPDRWCSTPSCSSSTTPPSPCSLVPADEISNALTLNFLSNFGTLPYSLAAFSFVTVGNVETVTEIFLFFVWF